MVVKKTLGEPPCSIILQGQALRFIIIAPIYDSDIVKLLPSNIDLLTGSDPPDRVPLKTTEEDV